MTEVTVWGHAAVSLEKESRCLTIDPGIFSLQKSIDRAEAVLLTHTHPDHLDLEGLRASDVPIWGDDEVVSALTSQGFSAERLHTLEPGDVADVAGFVVEAFGGDHAIIHRDLPREANLAYIVDGQYLHPGDSFSVPGPGRHPAVLFLPVSAPWLNFTQVVDYVREIDPDIVIPIHDASLSEPGIGLTDRVLAELLDKPRYVRLEVGEPHTLLAG